VTTTFGRSSKPARSFLLGAKERIVPNSMIWAIGPKGRNKFADDDIRHRSPSTGLIDVKTIAFPVALAAPRFVIPLALR
jgi:hypothetical protein